MAALLEWLQMWLALSIGVSVGDNGRVATIDVSDTGPGIPEAARDLVFDRFYRSSDASNGTTGTGLGLSIAKGAVEATGGVLSLERTSAEGSTFRIALPRVTGAGPVHLLAHPRPAGEAG